MMPCTNQTCTNQTCTSRNRVVVLIAAGLFGLAPIALWPGTALAHHPDRESQPVRPRIEVIPPIGQAIPDHRRSFNRPSRWLGRLAHKFAPTSQEAMSWHAAEHRGDYDRDCPVRVVPRYEFAKPWEVLPIGARSIRDPSDRGDWPITRPTGLSDSRRLEEAGNPLSHSEESPPSPTSEIDAIDEMDLQAPEPKIDLKEPILQPPKPRIEPTSEMDFEF